MPTATERNEARARVDAALKNGAVKDRRISDDVLADMAVAHDVAPRDEFLSWLRRDNDDAQRALFARVAAARPDHTGPGAFGRQRPSCRARNRNAGRHVAPVRRPARDDPGERPSRRRAVCAYQHRQHQRRASDAADGHDCWRRDRYNGEGRGNRAAGVAGVHPRQTPRAKRRGQRQRRSGAA